MVLGCGHGSARAVLVMGGYGESAEVGGWSGVEPVRIKLFQTFSCNLSYWFGVGAWVIS